VLRPGNTYSILVQIVFSFEKNINHNSQLTPKINQSFKHFCYWTKKVFDIFAIPDLHITIEHTTSYLLPQFHVTNCLNNNWTKLPINSPNFPTNHTSLQNATLSSDRCMGTASHTRLSHSHPRSQTSFRSLPRSTRLLLLQFQTLASRCTHGQGR
jgi:hypothetical protein